jgi:hypothetical protein
VLLSLSDEAFTQDGLILVPPILFSRRHGERLQSRVPKARNVLRAHGITEEFATCATTPRPLNLLRRFRSAFKLAFAIPFTYKLDPE